MNTYAILLQYYYRDSSIWNWFPSGWLGWTILLLSLLYIPLIARAVFRNLRG